MNWYVLALFLVSYTAQAADDTSFTSYQDSAGKIIHLATEETHPFLFQGWRVDQNHHEKHKIRLQGVYRSSIREFSSVLDCLMPEARRQEKPDLTKIDWRKIDTNEDAAVCLFRIASSYATPKDMEEWMKVQGFRVFVVGPVKSDQSRGVGVSGTWSTKKAGSKFYSNWFVRAWIYLFANGESYSVQYDKDANTYHIGVGQTYL